MSWNKSIIHWREEDNVYVSVAFTWHLPLAHKLCQWNTQAGFRVLAGGPAVELMPHYLADVAEVGGNMYPLPLSRHNPDATFTTRGCIRRCTFCAVPKIEGDFRELNDWIPAPIVCDNNLLASSQKHFDTVIDRLKVFKGVDFNQGLDARLLNAHHIERLQELRLPILRFAWDDTSNESVIMDAIARILAAGFPKRRVHCYALFGYNDTSEDALYRADKIKEKGIRPFMMRYQPLNALKKDQFDTNCMGNWTEKEMSRFTRYWCRQNWFSKIPYKEFDNDARS
ncbi:MAG: hypothetical protein PHI12_07440 [Dehalococcoidales bacterium]|nr:hypothetical protein [Dehalococcoidales bacterium]